MRIACVCFTKTGWETMRKLVSKAFSEDVLSDGERVCWNPAILGGFALHPEMVPDLETFQYPLTILKHGELGTWTEKQFRDADAILFVGACGIAVRAIAPFVADKFLDPAVLCMDETGRFVIPVLSGHLGGANRLAEEISGRIGAIPVITTATDLEKKFAVDLFAKDYNLQITDRILAKEISAALLAGDEVGFFSDFPSEEEIHLPKELSVGKLCRKNIWITLSDREKKPFLKENTLRLVPKCLILGIGCKKGISMDAISQAVFSALKETGIDAKSIACIASIDLKKEEEGLRSFARACDVSFNTFSAEELNAVPGHYKDSEFVKMTTGVGNVCERSAMAACQKKGEKPVWIFRKRAGHGVTVAAVGIENPLKGKKICVKENTDETGKDA